MKLVVDKLPKTCMECPFYDFYVNNGCRLFPLAYVDEDEGRCPEIVNMVVTIDEVKGENNE